MLNAEPDHRSSSAYTPNVEPDHGPVHEKSGSNRGSEPDFRITNLDYSKTCNGTYIPITIKSCMTTLASGETEQSTNRVKIACRSGTGT